MQHISKRWVSGSVACRCCAAAWRNLLPAHQPREGQLADEQVGAALVLADLTQRDRAWPVPVRLLCTRRAGRRQRRRSTHRRGPQQEQQRPGSLSPQRVAIFVVQLQHGTAALSRRQQASRSATAAAATVAAAELLTCCCGGGRPFHRRPRLLARGLAGYPLGRALRKEER